MPERAPLGYTPSGPHFHPRTLMSDPYTFRWHRYFYQDLYGKEFKKQIREARHLSGGGRDGGAGSAAEMES